MSWFWDDNYMKYNPLLVNIFDILLLRNAWFNREDSLWNAKSPHTEKERVRKREGGRKEKMRGNEVWKWENAGERGRALTSFSDFLSCCTAWSFEVISSRRATTVSCVNRNKTSLMDAWQQTLNAHYLFEHIFSNAMTCSYFYHTRCLGMLKLGWQIVKLWRKKTDRWGC